MSNVNEKRVRKTTVEDETTFKGTLTSKCPVVVLGHLEGEVEAPSLHIESSGSVAGTVNVKQLSSEGSLAGEVDAEEVLLSGSVKDKTVIRASSLEVKLTREAGKMEVIFGECELAIGDEPSKEAAIETAQSAGKPAPAADGDGKNEDSWDLPAGEEGEPAAAADEETEESGKKTKRKRSRRSSQQPTAG